jgi:ribosome biogenesis GTPase
MSMKEFNPTHQGTVIKRNLGRYFVENEGEIFQCGLSSRFQPADPPESGKRPQKAGAGRGRVDGKKPGSSGRGEPVVVGDLVQFSVHPGGEGSIQAILPRRSWLSRRSPVPMPTARPYEMVIVANVDQVVAVFAAADPPPHWNMLDRYLVSAESNKLAAVVCINKLDLAKNGGGELPADLQQAVERYRKIGYPVLLASAVSKEGLEDVRAALQGKLSVLVGKSGVGKTSLLNALQPGLGQRVGEVSQTTGKGRHTTSHQELFHLDFGGAIVDTPGVREFGLWDMMPGEIPLFFPEMRPYLGRCKFGMGCEHDEEPGCAVRAAVLAGEISPQRYQSYLKLRSEIV